MWRKKIYFFIAFYLFFFFYVFFFSSKVKVSSLCCRWLTASLTLTTLSVQLRTRGRPKHDLSIQTNSFHSRQTHAHEWRQENTFKLRTHGFKWMELKLKVPVYSFIFCLFVVVFKLRLKNKLVSSFFQEENSFLVKICRRIPRNTVSQRINCTF